jgi:hypothetical protein
MLIYTFLKKLLKISLRIKIKDQGLKKNLKKGFYCFKTKLINLIFDIFKKNLYVYLKWINYSFKK